MTIKRYIVLLFCLMLFISCRTAKNNTLFNTETSINMDNFSAFYEKARANYLIQPFDHISISVFTNDGEILIDPNREFEIGTGNAQVGQNQNGAGVGGVGMGGANMYFMQPLSINSNNQRPSFYRVNHLGEANLPLLKKVKLGGLTLEQADSLLSEAYQIYYKDAFVITQYTNKSVIVLGVLGSHFIPIRNENMGLLEVIALAGDISNVARTDNIRVVRGYKKDSMSVQVVNLSTIEGLKKADLRVMDGDIVYIEPRFIDNLNQISTPIQTFTSLLTGLLSLTVLIISLRATP